MENLAVLELEKILSDKIKSLRELEAKIDKLYQVGDTDYADNLDIALGVQIEEIIEIEDIIERKKEG